MVGSSTGLLNVSAGPVVSGAATTVSVCVSVSGVVPASVATTWNVPGAVGVQLVPLTTGATTVTPWLTCTTGCAATALPNASVTDTVKGTGLPTSAAVRASVSDTFTAAAGVTVMLAAGSVVSFCSDVPFTCARSTYAPGRTRL